MDINYGAAVEDKNGEVLGKVDYIMLDTWTGQPRRFLVRRQAPLIDLYFSPEQVTEATEAKVKLGLSLKELEQES